MAIDKFTSYCETPLDIIQSKDFEKGLKILLNYNKRFEKEYFLSIFEKISNEEILNEKEINDLDIFLYDKELMESLNKILNRSNGIKDISFNIKGKTIDGIIDYTNIIKSIFSKQGNTILRGIINKVTDDNNQILSSKSGKQFVNEIGVFGEPNEKDKEIIKDWEQNHTELYDLLLNGTIKFGKEIEIKTDKGLLKFSKDDVEDDFFNEKNGNRSYSETRKLKLKGEKIPTKEEFEECIKLFKGEELEFKKLLNLKDGFYWTSTLAPSLSSKGDSLYVLNKENNPNFTSKNQSEEKKLFFRTVKI